MLLRFALLAALVVCGGCGGGDSPPASSVESIGTLAYVVSECRDDPGFVVRQELRIQQGDRAPVTVAQIPELGPAAISGLCRTIQARLGDNSVEQGALTRLNVSPDGSTVAFEVTDAFSIIFRNVVPPEQ